MKCDTIEELERFLQIQVQALGKVSPEVAITLSKLANLYATNGNYAKAEILHNRALEIRLSVTGSHQSEIEDSRRSLRRVRELREKVERQKASGTDSAVRISSAGKEITTSENGTRQKPSITDTMKEMELEVALLKQMVGADHPAVADSLTKLAELYCKAKMYDQMEPPLVEALRVREVIYGPEHPNICSELKNLAQLYVTQEKYAMAEPLFKRAIAIRENALGASHPKVVDMEAQYAKLLRKTKRIAQAEELEKHIKEMRRSSTGNADALPA
jgi:tetratricopeptide (TPR) repeat protein